MNDADRRLFATWQHIAERASKETDPDKLAQVVEELRAALTQRENNQMIPKNPAGGQEILCWHSANQAALSI